MVGRRHEEEVNADVIRRSVRGVRQSVRGIDKQIEIDVY